MAGFAIAAIKRVDENSVRTLELNEATTLGGGEQATSFAARGRRGGQSPDGASSSASAHARSLPRRQEAYAHVVGLSRSSSLLYVSTKITFVGLDKPIVDWPNPRAAPIQPSIVAAFCFEH
jgi:hypothetical protein